MINKDKYLKISSNPSSVKLSEIPVLNYTEFALLIDELLNEESNHCINYFAFPFDGQLKFFCLIANDILKEIYLFSHEQKNKIGLQIESFTKKHFQLHVFEREINENFGINFSGHPWLKPIRFPVYSNSVYKKMNNYPFYKMDSEELHEVNVGPIHAGIIEPGCFRFICNGENVLHLEIHLGYQNRGLERLFSEKKDILQKTMLAESIAGDTTVGHTLCFSQLIDSLSEYTPTKELSIERIVALELERIASHIGDTAALCTDIAYQFGQVTNEALRTVIINTTQLWCGNRFGKGLIRPNGTNYPLINETVSQIKNNLNEIEKRYLEISDMIFTLPSVLARFEGIGKVSQKQAWLIGTVGVAARSSGLKRDIRSSHPFQFYKTFGHEPSILNKGDVWSRAMIRRMEIQRSISVVKEILNYLPEKQNPSKINYNIKLNNSSLAVSLVEGWRGEICHTGITDENGKIVHYKVKDPSLHNWMALALAVRGQEISDFPLCNKSYNLSYCGNDL